jgi:hypothetical protein
MVWATSFLHNGQHLSMADAASNASMVPIGWVIGCPLLGYISDKIGLRKLVLIGGALVMLAAGLAALYLPDNGLPRYLVPLALGVGSGAAMIPFTMIKEANPSEVKGTAAGVMKLPGLRRNGNHVAVHFPADGAVFNEFTDSARISDGFPAVDLRHRAGNHSKFRHSRDWLEKEARKAVWLGAAAGRVTVTKKQLAV